MVKVYRRKHTPPVALKAGCCVLDFQTGDDTNVFRGIIRHQHTSHRPVHNVHAAHVAGANRKVIAFVGTGAVQAWKVGWVVGEVGVHLEDVLVVMRQTPFETADVGGP